MHKKTTYLGMDVHKETIPVGIAEEGKDGDVRFYGILRCDAESIRKFVAKLGKIHSKIEYTYEAGPCGYAICRQLCDLACICHVIAPNLTADNVFFP